MTNTKKSLLVVGGLVLSYALVALDTVGASGSSEPAPSDATTAQEKREPIRMKDSPFAQGLLR